MMHPFKKLRSSRHAEEALGLIGIFYVAALAFASFLLIRFLVSAVWLSTEVTPWAKTPPATFNIDIAESATTR